MRGPRRGWSSYLPAQHRSTALQRELPDLKIDFAAARRSRQPAEAVRAQIAADWSAWTAAGVQFWSLAIADDERVEIGLDPTSAGRDHLIDRYGSDRVLIVDGEEAVAL